MTFHRWDDADLLLDLHVQPRASRDEIGGAHGNALKVRITAPPVDGKANRHLLRFLADVFGVAQNAVELLAGETGRRKTVRIRRPARLPDNIPRPEKPQATR